MYSEFFTLRVVKHWNKLPSEAVVAPSLETFNSGLSGALSNLVWWEMSLPIGKELHLDDLKYSFQAKPFYDSMNSPEMCNTQLQIHHLRWGLTGLSHAFSLVLEGFVFPS